DEALSEPFSYQIEFTSADKTLTPQQMLMQDAAFTLQAPVDQGFGVKIRQPVRTIQGVVTAFVRLSASRDETHYSLTLQPRLALLSRSHQNRIYQDMSVPDIVEHILRTRHGMRGEDFIFTLAQAYPRREQVMQYGEDDLRFITRLLSEVGIWFRFIADTRLNIDVVEFYDDQRHDGQGLVLPSVPPSGQHDSGTESVWALKSRHRVVPQSVFTRDYNYRNAPAEMSLSIDVSRGDSTTYGEAYHWGDNYLTPGDSHPRDPAPESGAFYARLRIARPVMAGTLPARVTSTKSSDIYGHIDRDGRYRVSLLFDRDHWPPGEESLWVRQARPYAGDTYGLHLPLLAGTEVAIAFEQGDPDRPYIAGVLHDSAHPDPVTIRNYKRNVLRTPANNKIRLEDGGKQPRGEGFELRTDSYGAIRAGKGIFITADAQMKAQGQQLAMEPATSLLRGAQNLIAGWESVTQTHRNFSPDMDTLKQFVEKADQIKKPVLLMEAPEGIGSVTPESILLHSGNGLYMQSIGEVSIASEQRLAVNASQAISLLSRQEGVRLVSAKGPLNIESHSDILSLTSLQDVTVQSTQGHLQLTAKNGITIGCGGAYIRLTPQGEIEIHGPGLLSLKGQHNLQGPASEDFQLPDLPSSVCKECLKRAQELAQGFVPRDA
ncbi:MAG: type VI secretion system tip protein VgrG, partial [Klebsiella oxytoca]|nr:type VI secretion system tip protein VgrG [Klebsiella oxytoca]